MHYRQYSSRIKLSMRQTHKAGEKLFVDYSGDGITIVDPQTGEIRLAQIFVAVLGASGYTIACATLSQKLPGCYGRCQMGWMTPRWKHDCSRLPPRPASMSCLTAPISIRSSSAKA